ncbi:MAG: hypothetical protein PWQ79_2329, partial [Thermococcaceae archaeon]|nr:hypothetical protein [Thermococcaceae archaeon]
MISKEEVEPVKNVKNVVFVPTENTGVKHPFYKDATYVIVHGGPTNNALKTLTLLQLASIPIAMKTKLKDKFEIQDKIENYVLPKIIEREENEFIDILGSHVNRIGDDPIHNATLAAYHTIPYDRLVDEKLEDIARILWKATGLSEAGVSYTDYLQYLKVAAKAAEKIGEMQAKTLQYKGGKHILEPLNGKIEQIEEMHELAELLKKMVPEKVIPPEERPKFREVQTQVREGDSFAELPNLPSNVLLEVLSILQALEFADYSEKAKEKALEKLSSTIKELSRKDPTPENLLKLGPYAYAA